MAYADLRAYMDRLEKEGDLKRIKAEVDWNLELGAIMRRANDLREPALLFEKIKGYPSDCKVFANFVGAARPNVFGRVCLSLELPVNTPAPEIIEEIVHRFEHPIKPVLVDKGPCKENIIKGDAIDVLKLPAPHFLGFDGGRFIGTWHTDITRDPDSGWVNWGMYRHMVHDGRSIGWLANPGQHGPGMYYRRYEAKGEAMPMAVVIGTDPACASASMSLIASHVNEVDLAGGLRGEPVQLVKCETIDLEVPATAEIVLEGEVLPGERRPEGPFGEYPGYFASDGGLQPVFRVNCVTHRNQPILPVSTPGKPLDDTTFVYSLYGSAALAMELRKMGFPFKSVYLTPSMMAVIISAKETYPGYVHTLSSAIWGTKVGVYRPVVIVVGDDVDVTNMDEVMWALTTRVHPVRDIHVKKRAPSHALFPFLSPEERATHTGAAVCYDATFPFEWKEDTPRIADFKHAWPEEIQNLVLSRWKEYGFK